MMQVGFSMEDLTSEDKRGLLATSEPLEPMEFFRVALTTIHKHPQYPAFYHAAEFLECLGLGSQHAAVRLQRYVPDTTLKLLVDERTKHQTYFITIRGMVNYCFNDRNRDQCGLVLEKGKQLFLEFLIEGLRID